MPGVTIAGGASDQQWRARVGELLSQLQPVELHILRERFGIDGHEEQTLHEIGGELSRERVRQLQNRALQRLRSNVEDTGPFPARTLEQQSA
jgi:DNA-directed RNA polymerase sigma subunit (sigma70/sigma32)